MTLRSLLLLALSTLASTRAAPNHVVYSRAVDAHSGPLYSGMTSNNHSCVLTPKIESCSSEADHNLVDSCCVETYGGLGLQAQFWDTYTGLEDEGQLLPLNNWTIHGLWPDYCNGSYPGYCDLSRQYDPDPSPATLDDGTEVPAYNGLIISKILKDFGRYDLLNYMNNYWVSSGSPNEEFWAHEFSKHATCYSTFQTASRYTEHEEVVDFFDTVVASYKRVPTYDWLARKDIYPSNSTTYTYADLEDALNEAYGAIPYIGCSGPAYNETEAGKGSTDDGPTVLSEVWYYRYFYGRPQDLEYVPVNTTYDSRCARSPGALTYPEKTTTSVRTD